MAPQTTGPVAAAADNKLPFEIIEEILMLIPTLDLVIASSIFPPFWRSVFESSTKIRPRLINYFISLNANIYPRTNETTSTWTFRFEAAEGYVFAHRRASGAEGWIYLSRRGHMPLTVLDPGTKWMSWYTFRHERNNHGRISLYDVEGRHVCTKDVKLVVQGEDLSISRYILNFW